MNRSVRLLVATIALSLAVLGLAGPASAIPEATCSKVAPATHDAHARCLAIVQLAKSQNGTAGCAQVPSATHDAHARCLAITPLAKSQNRTAGCAQVPSATHDAHGRCLAVRSWPGGTGR
jgi:hypothetical protein